MARPKSDRHPGETVPGVRVVALQAPLSFLNAYVFQRAIQPRKSSCVTAWIERIVHFQRYEQDIIDATGSPGG